VHFGAGGLGTAEVRWILPGTPDAATTRWFGRYPAGMETREDAYLLHPVLRGLSVKLRGGCLLEVKVYEGSLGILDSSGHARGRIELWRKWSFPFGALGPGNTGTPGWTVVHKRRWIIQFRQHSGQLKSETPLPADAPERAGESACAVELTEIRSGEETWWSLGFEATGPADRLRRTLQATAALVFAEAPPGHAELDLGHCQSYADWLSRRRVPSDDDRPPACGSQPGCELPQASGGPHRPGS
jgi:hypothetical protein